jgi:hypothetical protein
VLSVGKTKLNESCAIVSGMEWKSVGLYLGYTLLLKSFENVAGFALFYVPFSVRQTLVKTAIKTLVNYYNNPLSLFEFFHISYL